MRIVSGIVEKQVLQSDKTKEENAESSFSLMYTSVPYWSIFYYFELMGKKDKTKLTVVLCNTSNFCINAIWKNKNYRTSIANTNTDNFLL